MYRAIEKHPPTLEIYAKALEEEGSFTQDEIKKHKDWVWSTLDKAVSLMYLRFGST